MTLVGCMKTGKNMVLYLGRVPVDFLTGLDGGPGNLPWGTIFHFEKWRKEENFKSIVRPYENVDAFGNKGAYYMQDLFTISILMDIDDEDEDENQKTMKTMKDYLQGHLKQSFDVFHIDYE